MNLPKVLSLVVVSILVATVSLAQNRVLKGSFEDFGSDVIGQCEGFEVVTDYVYKWVWIDLLDKNGQWVKERVHFKVIGESIYYNSENLSKSVIGGPGEGQSLIMDPVTGEIHAAGPAIKVRVPGYGPIFYENGLSTWQCEPYTFANCVRLTDTGFNQWDDKDLAAICNYLK